MAELDIAKATHGWNGEGLLQLGQKIHSEVIGESITKLNNNFGELVDAINAIWVGRSADQFKQNMHDDVEKIMKALVMTEEQLNTELMNAVDAMQDIDTNLVKPRSE